MSKYWNEVNASEASAAYESVRTVQYRTKREFNHIKAHWNPVEASHRFSDAYQYRVLIIESTT